MKQILALLLCTLLLAGGYFTIAYAMDHPPEVLISLSDDGITVNGGRETKAVFTSHDIIYHENREYYDNGNRYGEGTPEERHSEEEAAAHTVVNITAPGTYRVTGKLSAGQIRVDLGEKSYYDPNAVVTLILSDADITCTVGPAILFLNTFECDNDHSKRSASLSVDTTQAGANLVIEGSNVVNGSHVAKIYKDRPKEKKLWKQDGAIHSQMSLNIDGTGELEVTGDLEGLSSELHLTVRGGDIAIRAHDDGINASKEGISVITIDGGFLRVLSGLDNVEGDGIDSNGYFVIKDGTMVVWANPTDSPLDCDRTVMIMGGTVIALGANEDQMNEDSPQSTMYLSGAYLPDYASSIVVTDKNGSVVLAYDPAKDDFFAGNTRPHIATILSCPNFWDLQVYQLQMGATLAGIENRGVYQQAEIVEPGIPMRNVSTAQVTNDFALYDQISFFDLIPDNTP